ncbi:hypothetical protein CRS_40500 [Chryseobacterium sp. ON_d1]|nr:hypothetical protein CRS_40500 [Chryseobacterium sp. ON_d1]
MGFVIIRAKSEEFAQRGKESIDIYNTKRPHLSLNMQTPDKVHKKSEEINTSPD